RSWRRLGGGAMTTVLAAAIATTASAADGRGPVAALRSDLIDALVYGWATIATTPTPVDATPRLLVPLVVGVTGATVAGVATMRLRTTAPVAPILPGLAVIVASSIAAGGTGDAPVLLGTATVALVATFLIARRLGDGIPAADGRTGAAGVVGAVTAIALVGVFATPTGLAAEGDPFDPRDHLRPPVVAVDATDPLDLVASMRLEPERVLAVVETDAASPLRLVALDRFDGARWTSSATFRRFGRPIDRPARTAVDVRRVSMRVDVVSLDGPWLPAADDPIEVVGTAALIDPVSGTLVADAGQADLTGRSDGNPAATSYQLIADVPVPSIDALRSGLPIASDATADAALELPAAVSERMIELADTLTSNAPSAFDEAILLSDHLARTVRGDRSIPGGTSADQLDRMLFDTNVGNDMQVASAFAVLARAAGLPTRLVVGFDPAAAPGPGRFELRPADLRVWPEIGFDDVGWVPFRLPSAESGSGGVLVGFGGEQPVVVAEAEPSSDASTGDATELQALPPVVAPDLDPAVVPAPIGAGDVDGSSAWPAVIVAAVGVAAVGAVAAISVAKRLRTRRRRAVISDPRAHVLGAWDDVLDRLREARREPADPETATVEDIVEHDPDVAPILAGLYGPVQHALYGDGPLTDDDAARVWRSRDRLVARLGETAPLTERVRRHLDPRSLRRTQQHERRRGRRHRRHDAGDRRADRGARR
ncbi:MAG: transglutaminaseTgpA domain-containing protein, partial [Actinomycetota bacterium]